LIEVAQVVRLADYVAACGTRRVGAGDYIEQTSADFDRRLVAARLPQNG
jgi:hypothetical protein